MTDSPNLQRQAVSALIDLAKKFAEEYEAQPVAFDPKTLLTAAIREYILNQWHAYANSDAGREVCQLAIKLCREEQGADWYSSPEDVLVRGHVHHSSVCTVHGPSREGYPKHYETALFEIWNAQPLWGHYIGKATAILDERAFAAKEAACASDS